MEDNRYNLITKDLEEVIGDEKLNDILKTRNLSLYWGTATTGKPHIGYLMPLLKIKDFLEADCDITILFADLYHIDALKSQKNSLMQGKILYCLLKKHYLPLG